MPFEKEDIVLFAVVNGVRHSREITAHVSRVSNGGRHIRMVDSCGQRYTSNPNESGAHVDLNDIILMPRKGDHVEFDCVEQHVYARVTDTDGRRIRMVTMSGRRYSTEQENGFEYIVRSNVKNYIFGVYVFDTILDLEECNTTSRCAANFWTAFCNASGWAINYERIHSRADLRYFLRKRTIYERVMIFNGHGEEEGLLLSNGSLVNANLFEVTVENSNKIVILSSCLIGRNGDLSMSLLNAFHADILFAYRYEVSDNICFLIESLLLTLLSQPFARATECYRKVLAATKFLGPLNQQNAKLHPLVMYRKKGPYIV